MADYNKRCEWCSGPFTAGNSRGRFCSGKCRAASHRAGGTKTTAQAPSTPTGAESGSTGLSDPYDGVSVFETNLEAALALSEQAQEAGLTDAATQGKLHRIRVIARLLDEQPNQPALLNQYRSLEQDVERLLPAPSDDAYENLLRELQMSAETFANEGEI